MKLFLPMAVGLCFAILACNQASDNENNKEAIKTADSTLVYGNGSSAAAVQNNADTVHRFVRTADLKFKVGNVEKTVYQVEDIVGRHGGFVTLTQLNSNKEAESVTPLSEDSAVETTAYSVTNTMMVRIPNTRLDTALKDIAKLVGYLDYRIVKADDVGLQIRANSLQQKRSTQQVVRLENVIDQQGKKVLETTLAEENLESKQAKADEAQLANLSLADQVNFSTVQLSIYQRTAIKKEVVATEKPMKAYEPSFGKKVLFALQNGFEVLKTLFIGVLQIWPLLLLAGIGIWGYRKYKVAHPAGMATARK